MDIREMEDLPPVDRIPSPNTKPSSTCFGGEHVVIETCDMGSERTEMLEKDAARSRIQDADDKY
ncbi:hypothetical protein GQ43DRAFT_212601 [Delitschia confertaspora ATCC 74209]|uniref:Uncharacterized protein n=1 Tax=Delitschia confertaspora ATCC 74209 TaxID=1513339 RepID=A0A9P4MNQ0_9PLEO|nr:hypothetical protein GQ43DRAFT_212601 [Delitschia confertaspora ATCC 74209]